MNEDKLIVQFGRLDKSYRNLIPFSYEGITGQADLSNRDYYLIKDGKKLNIYHISKMYKTFKADFQKTDRSKDKVRLQETVAKVSCRLQENNGDITKLKGGHAGGILYDNYTGENSGIGHFRINDNLRVSCEYKNKVLELRHYGTHNDVNDNP